MKIVFYTAGGTIDKIYFDAKSKYEVGESILGEILRDGNITFTYECKVIMQKDSLDLDDRDRQIIYQTIDEEVNPYVILTHGTDTMVETAKFLQGIAEKVIVLTGSISPARFRSSDALFNIACSIGAVQTLKPGVYICMNGRIFTPDNVIKNVEKSIFENLCSA